jgi:oligopeptide/dipeptide ABC transporter ATP-binding protein
LAQDPPLLEVRDLRTVYKTDDGVVRAVDGVSFDVRLGETLAIVGESGCGKSQTCLSIMRLIAPPGSIAGGTVVFRGEDLLTKSSTEMRAIRGNKISMIFQEPMTALNPVFTIGDQLAEAIRLHRNVTRAEAMQKAVEALHLVGIASAAQRVRDYPHQLSGGMRQRVMIAMALFTHPDLLIADEPTTALDVTIQAQILELMKRLKQTIGMSIMLITHDLGVVAEMAERVVVMYGGKVVEAADVSPLFANPGHPYTEGLLNSIPRMDVESDTLSVIEGNVPNPRHLPSGCRFHPRCPYVADICRVTAPDLEEVLPGRYVACHFARERIGREGAEAYAASAGQALR